MATRTPKTPPTIHEAFDTPKAPEPKPATPPATGVADRGVEQSVPFYHAPNGLRYVASPHKDAGRPW